MAEEKNWHWTDWLLLLPLAAAIYLFVYICGFIFLDIFAHPNSTVEGVVAGFATTIAIFAAFSKPPIDYDTNFKIQEAKARRNN